MCVRNVYLSCFFLEGGLLKRSPSKLYKRVGEVYGLGSFFNFFVFCFVCRLVANSVPSGIAGE